MTSTEVREPTDFDGSSPDDPCGACGHPLRAHPWDKVRGNTNPERDKLVRRFRMQCLECARLEEPSVSWIHDFVPADPEAAPDEQVHKWTRCDGCGHPQHSMRCSEEHPAAGDMAGRKCGCLQVTSRQDIANACRLNGGCAEHSADAETVGEPEAPVCTHDHWDEGFMRCQDCGFEPESPGSPAPLRPPILVAYATGSGDLNELALPGDVTAAVVDGTLVISHASGVLGIVHVKPLELEN